MNQRARAALSRDVGEVHNPSGTHRTARLLELGTHDRAGRPQRLLPPVALRRAPVETIAASGVGTNGYRSIPIRIARKGEYVKVVLVAEAGSGCLDS